MPLLLCMGSMVHTAKQSTNCYAILHQHPHRTRGGAMSIAQLTTADDLLQLSDDGFRYELINGELRQMTPAGEEHGSTAMSVGG